MLEARHIAKAYGYDSVVNDVSLSVRRGEVVALLGPNGAGKTTLFQILIGVEIADRGQVVLDGEDVSALPLFERARRGLSYLPQESTLYRGLTVEQNILLVLEANVTDRAQQQEVLNGLLGAFGIEHVRRSRASSVSGGERRRCEIARSLAARPRFMLLDEPFAGIDPIAISEIRDLVFRLTERGIGVLITDHNVRETLRMVDRAYIIESGRIFAHGTVEQVISDPEVRRVYLDPKFRL
jgi:lipopolysaccharide export system ATP-binding protein